MRTFQLQDEIFDYQGKPEILYTPFYKITTESAKIMEIVTDTYMNGIVILGPVEALVDTIIYTESHGAVGNTTTFTGTNLVILNLLITELEEFLLKSQLNDQEKLHWKNKADKMISKLKHRIEDPDTCMNVSFGEEEDEDLGHIIFGRRNFLLIGSEKKFVLINKQQVTVREGERKLVQVDKDDGVLIANSDNVLNIGGTSRSNLGSLLGNFGINIASSVLDQILYSRY